MTSGSRAQPTIRLRWGRRRGRLAVAHATHGHPHDALRHAEAAIRHLSRRDPVGELAATYQVAAAALEQLGRLDDASTAWRLAVQCAPDQPRRCSSLIGLGDLLRFRGQFDEAERCLHEALAASAHAADPAEPPLRALALNALGIVCKDTGRYHEASAAHAQALAGLTSWYGPDHTMVASVWHNIAALARARGRLIEAEAAARRAVVIREHANGIGHRLVALDLAVLGAALVDLHRTAEAERCFERALEVHRARTPADRYEFAANLANVARCRARDGDLLTAERLLREATAVKASILGAHHPEVARDEDDLAAIGADAAAASTDREARR